MQKPRLSEIHLFNGPTRNLEGVDRNFKSVFDSYRIAQSRLDAVEAGEIGSIDPELIDEVNNYKERIANMMIELYVSCKTLEEFEAAVKKVIGKTVKIGEDKVDQYIATDHMLPFTNLRRAVLPSAIESIWSSLENMKLVQEFIEVGKKHADGIIMSGSTAWGTFFATKGKTPVSMAELGAEIVDHEQISDIDLLVTCETVDDLGQIINDYVKAGLIKETELDRFKTFQQLNIEGKADVFSVRSYYKDVEESIHFLLNPVVKKLANCKIEDEIDGIQYLNDFRPNQPKNLTLHGGGYLVPEIKSGGKAFLPVETSPVENNKGENLGYLSRLPIGGPIEKNGKKEYRMGILTFYLTISPVTYLDKSGQLKQNIDSLRDKISDQLGGDFPAYIIRQERMTKTAADKIKTSFTK